MKAPPYIDPVTAHSDVVHWLTNDTRDERFIDNNIFAELCVRPSERAFPSSGRRFIS